MAEYRKTLRWGEPWGAWVQDDFGDTGLCNRIFHWEIAHQINRCNNYEFYITLEKKYWPEVRLIELPDTKMISNVEGDDYEIEKLKFITVYDTVNKTMKTSTPITYDMLATMFKNDNFKLDENHYHADFGFLTLNQMCKRFNLNNLPLLRPLNLITLRHRIIEDYILKTMKDVVGLHIRRGNGIPFTQSDIDSVPKEYRKEFELLKVTKTVKAHKSYKFYRDDLYFNIIDKMIEINPNQKFYLSSDVPDKLMKYYYDKYEGRFIDKKEMFNMVLDYLMNAGFSKSDFSYGNTIENVIDLFSLSYCSFLIKVENSTWSDFADWRVSKPSAVVDYNWDDYIKPRYISYLEKRNEESSTGTSC